MRIGLFGGGEPLEANVPLLAKTRPTTRVRSSSLLASQHVLREMGHYAAYAETLRTLGKGQVLDFGVAEWASVSDILAHIDAIEALDLTPDDLERFGDGVGKRAYGAILATMLRLASGLGATPWTVLHQAPRLFARMSDGGGACVVFREAERQARLELWCSPFADRAVHRRAMLGSMRGSLVPLAQNVRATEVGVDLAHQAYAFRFSW